MNKYPGFPWSANPLLALPFVLLLGSVDLCRASAATVPDGYATIQLGIDSGADTILVRAGSYPENVLLTPPVQRVLMADPAASARPTLQGLALQASDGESEPMKVVGLRISTQVVLLSGPPSAVMEFEGCLFEAGIGFAGEYGVQTIRDCVIRGHTSMMVGSFTMERDTVEAGGMSLAPTSGLSVRNCWFRGPGIGAEPYGALAGLSARARSPIYADVSDNVFENCQVGVALFEMGTMHVTNNRIRNCSAWGMVFHEYSLLEVTGNDVRQCGIGIQSWGNDRTRITGNTVVGATENGIELSCDYDPVEVRNNIVLRCLGSGMRLTSSQWGSSPLLLTGNTSALNSQSGYDLAFANTYPPGSNLGVSNNVGYGNGDWGFRWSGNDTPTLGCNDWFANAAGPVSGIAPGATDVAVNPLFCDLPHDDVSLRSDSPLLGGACGAIGAAGAGCSMPVGVDAEIGSASFGLRSIGPNPMSGEIAIEYALPRPAAIEITILDLMGRQMDRLVAGVQSPGMHVATWNGEARGKRVGPGVYFVRLTWPEGRQARRILLRR